MWTVTNGAIPHLLQPASALPGRADITDEIKKYSFDRLVVCEHASIAKFLIANKFHFENNCAVLSIDKYPQNLFETVMEMLRRNPALKVYALHDASPSGIQLAHRIATDADWFKGSSNVTIYDLGLLPRQLIDKSSFVLESMESAAVARLLLGGPGSASLRPDEDRWLRQGKHVSLESIPPKVLLRVAALGIARSRDPRAQDALVPLSGAEYGSGFYIFAYDSFG
jgi:hypothetical protein